jgi:hypothetical protein
MKKEKNGYVAGGARRRKGAWKRFSGVVELSLRDA